MEEYNPKSTNFNLQITPHKPELTFYEGEGEGKKFKKIKHIAICSEDPSNYLIAEWDNDFALINSRKIIKGLIPNKSKFFYSKIFFIRSMVQ